MIAPNRLNVEIGRMRMEEMRLRAERHRFIQQGKARTKRAKAALSQKAGSGLSERPASAAARIRTIYLQPSASGKVSTEGLHRVMYLDDHDEDIEVKLQIPSEQSAFQSEPSGQPQRRGWRGERSLSRRQRRAISKALETTRRSKRLESWLVVAFWEDSPSEDLLIRLADTQESV